MVWLAGGWMVWLVGGWFGWRMDGLVGGWMVGGWMGGLMNVLVGGCFFLVLNLEIFAIFHHRVNSSQTSVCICLYVTLFTLQCFANIPEVIEYHKQYSIILAGSGGGETQLTQHPVLSDEGTWSVWRGT